MLPISRKLIEEFYDKEWSNLVSSETIRTLIELTCQAYKLNEMPKKSFVKTQEILKPHRLGQI